MDPGVLPDYPSLEARGNTGARAPDSILIPVTVPSTVATTPGIVLTSGIQSTTTTTVPISTVPQPSTNKLILNTNLTGNPIQEAHHTEEEQPVLKETGSESDDTSGSDSDSDNSVVEVAPP